MQTIAIIARSQDWEQAQVDGQYTQSTIDSSLADVGFIHCHVPEQTLEIANRKYAEHDNLVRLLVDTEKVKAPIKYEAALSGRAGTFPHIYGPLNVDAVYEVQPLKKNPKGRFEL